MEREYDQHEMIELGVVSADTKGLGAGAEDSDTSLRFVAGLCDD